VEMQVNVLDHTNKINSLIASKSDKAILFYSGGKDSIALLHLMQPHFKEIVVVFMYFVQGLEHIDKYLLWAKQFDNVKILQVPHWGLCNIYRSGVFCVKNDNVKSITLNDIDKAIKVKTGIEYSFYGMKASDSMNRSFMMKEYELNAISKANKVYPLSAWKQADVLNYIKTHNLPMPIAYSNKKSQGLTFNVDCYLYLEKHYPSDLKKILQVFPLSEKLLIDYKIKQNEQSKKGTLQNK
jgi:3'-phosphoadenosine 5'-phosphosulfate sulfotransferase (PAPS reductase)/FAD synthetase